MVTDEFLKSLGFSSFVELNPKKRDEIPRLVWTNSLRAGEFITVKLVKLDTVWKVERILVDGMDSKTIVGESIPNETILEVIEFVKVKGTDTLFSE